MPDVEIADDRQRRFVDDLDQKLLVHVLAFAVHRLAKVKTLHGVTAKLLHRLPLFVKLAKRRDSRMLKRFAGWAR
jgi:hypothetical protein